MSGWERVDSLPLAPRVRRVVIAMVVFYGIVLGLIAGFLVAAIFGVIAGEVAFAILAVTIVASADIAPLLEQAVLQDEIEWDNAGLRDHAPFRKGSHFRAEIFGYIKGSVTVLIAAIIVNRLVVLFVTPFVRHFLVLWRGS